MQTQTVENLATNATPRLIPDGQNSLEMFRDEGSRCKEGTMGGILENWGWRNIRQHLFRQFSGLNVLEAI